MAFIKNEKTAFKKNQNIQIKGKSHHCCSNVWRTSLSLRLDLGEMWAQLFRQTLWDVKKKKKEKSSSWSQKRRLWFPSICANTHTGTNQPQILKEPYMTQKGHCGDYPMPQKISFFFFKSHLRLPGWDPNTFPWREEMGREEMLSKR